MIEHSGKIASDEMYQDMFETLHSQIVNGGFHQYYCNVIEHDKKHLDTLIILCEIGKLFEIDEFEELAEILEIYKERIEVYERSLAEVKRNISDAEMKRNLIDAIEDKFISDIEECDGNYDDISDEIRMLVPFVCKIASYDMSRWREPLSAIIDKLSRSRN